VVNRMLRRIDGYTAYFMGYRPWYLLAARCIACGGAQLPSALSMGICSRPFAVEHEWKTQPRAQFCDQTRAFGTFFAVDARRLAFLIAPRRIRVTDGPEPNELGRSRDSAEEALVELLRSNAAVETLDDCLSRVLA
jgi:hypothetical protein